MGIQPHYKPERYFIRMMFRFRSRKLEIFRNYS